MFATHWEVIVLIYRNTPSFGGVSSQKINRQNAACFLEVAQWHSDFPILPFSTVVFPRDVRKKEKFLKHITGKASLQTVLLLYVLS